MRPLLRKNNGIFYVHDRQQWTRSRLNPQLRHPAEKRDPVTILRLALKSGSSGETAGRRLLFKLFPVRALSSENKIS